MSDAREVLKRWQKYVAMGGEMMSREDLATLEALAEENDQLRANLVALTKLDELNLGALASVTAERDAARAWAKRWKRAVKRAAFKAWDDWMWDFGTGLEENGLDWEDLPCSKRPVTEPHGKRMADAFAVLTGQLNTAATERDALRERVTAAERDAQLRSRACLDMEDRILKMDEELYCSQGRILALEGALEKYGRHELDCHHYHGSVRCNCAAGCSCGFDAALRKP